MLKRNKNNKIKNNLSSSNTEILALKTKIIKLERNASESVSKKNKGKNKTVKNISKSVPPEENLAVMTLPSKEAQIEQPTLVKLGLEKLLKAILNSNIISKVDKSKSMEVLKPKYPYFMHLLNVFSKQNEQLQDLISGPPVMVVESENLLQKQYNHILIRWVVYIINKGICVLEKKYG